MILLSRKHSRSTPGCPGYIKFSSNGIYGANGFYTSGIYFSTYGLNGGFGAGNDWGGVPDPSPLRLLRICLVLRKNINLKKLN